MSATLGMGPASRRRVARKVQPAVPAHPDKLPTDAASAAAPKSPPPTIGFGCPQLSSWPHHIIVEIPEGRGGEILVSEDFGISGHTADAPDLVERCLLPRPRWNAMAEAAKADMNARLRDKGLATSRWQPGKNRVERVLGAELLCLAWAVQAADEAHVPAVVAAWVGLKPPERLFLAGRVLASPSDMARRGLALLLSASPTDADAAASRSPSPRSAPLPLFDLAD
ncbi:DUF3780 domain-containing protein [Paracraurococcus lichenis]|uniref:DUF3780 domain-containing protein n=1 Tax=Paracraurococcus lichenis TaxID=3064888 RepID=A0ABT9EAC9_9PROT|nr:DUF3780 domain-containing protein [Paracraurococcus sp. LOR1-02]MDO9713171.1 DUF3780 domain-containing protein [Paracraurococcus sp. LOR1-02]